MESQTDSDNELYTIGYNQTGKGNSYQKKTRQEDIIYKGGFNGWLGCILR